MADISRLRPAGPRGRLPVLAPGGVLMFQLPDEIARVPEEPFVNAPVVGGRLKQRLPRVLVRAYRHVKYWLIVDESVKRMAMFGMPHHDVLTLAREAGGRGLAGAPDQSHRPSPRRYEYSVSR